MNIIKHWVPLFEKHKITVVFENDHHTVKRTHRLTNGKKDPNGVLYLGDGSWGVKCRSIDEDKRGYLAYADGKNHLWHVTLTDDGAEYVALTEDGVVLDQCTTK